MATRPKRIDLATQHASPLPVPWNSVQIQITDEQRRHLARQATEMTSGKHTHEHVLQSYLDPASGPLHSSTLVRRLIYQRLINKDTVILDLTETLVEPMNEKRMTRKEVAARPACTPARCSASSRAPPASRCETSSASRASSA